MKKQLLLTMGLASTLLLAGCGGSSTAKVGYNIFGSGGSTALDTLAAQTKYALSTFGDTVTEKNENWTATNLETDIQDLIDAGNKGVNIWGISPDMIPSLAKKCNDAKVYFTLNDKIPSDTTVISEIKNMEYFAGAVAPDNASYGTANANYAVNQGWKKVLIVTASDLNDPSDGPRITAFRQIFEAASYGGTEVDSPVLNEQPTVAQTNIATALSGLDEAPDFIYATSSDYALAAVSALDSAGSKFANTKVITSGLEQTILEKQNESGSRVKFVNGDDWIAGYFSAILLHNAVTGNVIKDSSGNKVWFDSLKAFTVSYEDYANYKAYFIDSKPYTEAETKAFAKTDYATITKAMTNYSLSERVAARQ